MRNKQKNKALKTILHHSNYIIKTIFMGLTVFNFNIFSQSAEQLIE